MIDRQKDRTIVVHCDSCSEHLDTETADFPMARIMMNEEGWRYLGNDRHLCSSCQEDMKDF